MRGGSSEAVTSRKVESKSTRNTSACAHPSSEKATAKSSHQTLQNALSFGEQLQFMAMPVSGKQGIVF